MLAVTTYSQDYIDACHSRLEAQLAAYRTLVSSAREEEASAFRSAAETFEPLLLNNLILVLGRLLRSPDQSTGGQGRESSERSEDAVQLDPAQRRRAGR